MSARTHPDYASLVDPIFAARKEGYLFLHNRFDNF